MISEKKARIMTNNIVADINHILDVIAIINQATSEEEIRKCIPDLLEYLGMCSWQVMSACLSCRMALKRHMNGPILYLY